MDGRGPRAAQGGAVARHHRGHPGRSQRWLRPGVDRRHPREFPRSSAVRQRATGSGRPCLCADYCCQASRRSDRDAPAPRVVGVIQRAAHPHRRRAVRGVQERAARGAAPRGLFRHEWPGGGHRCAGLVAQQPGRDHRGHARRPADASRHRIGPGRGAGRPAPVAAGDQRYTAWRAAGDSGGPADGPGCAGWFAHGRDTEPYTPHLARPGRGAGFRRGRRLCAVPQRRIGRPARRGDRGCTDATADDGGPRPGAGQQPYRRRGVDAIPRQPGRHQRGRRPDLPVVGLPANAGQAGA